MALLRGAGFKLHVHWMPNLYGSSPERDVEDFEALFLDPDFRPDELKIYPCSLLESAELVRYYDDGRWRPYTEEELTELLVECFQRVPRYCRVTRVIRDIPGDEILVGNRVTNLRQRVERELEHRGLVSVDIRAREIRGRGVSPEDLELQRTEYQTSIGSEIFLEVVTEDDCIAGFLRLALPSRAVAPGEIAASAMIREVHVYGQAVSIGGRREGRAQHRGLGRTLVEAAAEIAAERGYGDLAVISAVGTRDYYRGLDFADGELYQHRRLAGRETEAA
jgi:elongator complex protein 3